jgi:predicted membrane metal-binding protein
MKVEKIKIMMNNIIFEKNKRLILILICGLIFILLIYFSPNKKIPCPYTVDMEKIYPFEFKGKIIRVYRDTINHYTPSLAIQNYNGLIHTFNIIFVYDLDETGRKPTLFERAKVGDSIYKPKNNLNLIYVSMKDSSRVKFPYSCETSTDTE